MPKGKPQKPGRPFLTMRVPVELRAALEAASKRERRTLTDEVIIRLERSLDRDKERMAGAA